MRLTEKKLKRFDVPNDPDKAWVSIELLKDGVLRDIKAKYTTTKVVDGEMEIEFDSHNENKDMAKACLKDWGNMFDENDRPLKFTALNVSKCGDFTLKIGEEKKSFFAWIFDCHEELAEEVAAELEVAEGN
jgi:hypothetical protein